MARVYTTDERASALAALEANGGDVANTAKALGIPRKTLAYWAQGKLKPERGEPLAMALPHKKIDLANLFEQFIGEAMGLANAKIPAANLKDTLVSVGVAVDKMRLLREQPTSIVGNNATNEQRIDRIRELAELAKRRRFTEPVGSGAAGACVVAGVVGGEAAAG